MEFVLLVTWFVIGQPPSSYQIDFNSDASCEAARAQVLQEQVRLQTAWQQEYDRWSRGGTYAVPPRITNNPPPTVTVVCAAR